MKILSYKFLIFLALLLWGLQAQRGGGGRRRSSGFRFRSRSRIGSSKVGEIDLTQTQLGKYLGLDKYFNTTNTSLAEARQQQKKEQQILLKKRKKWIKKRNKRRKQVGEQYMGVFGIFGTIGCILFLVWKYMTNKYRNQQIKSILQEYEKSYNVSKGQMDEKQLKNYRQWFIRKRWSIQFVSKNGRGRNTARVTQIVIEPKTNNKNMHNVFFKMSEDYGGSKAEGILMTYSDSSSIKFSKTYNNRTKANQIGFYDILLFEGTQEGQSFKGTWYYQGYQHTAVNSGVWQMTYK